ncbi:uncharacterized protein PV09_07667 [Verruconis gallopava]|uniref:Uncharacterized protein n=1 Tax=Verruconis gallopava TaxID=253628 RepID=A0A0D2AP78_9PEZI|nr:uncharacterized protein PV09_07667 [Verruconis gallopava]KIW00924.1 hypothetical protein PV09_07667 [Verruconis gallopava]
MLNETMAESPSEISLYNFPPQPANFDSVGIFFVTFLSAWTTLVACGMTFLIINRRNPIIKIRGLKLSLAAICMLHAYWILGQLVYPIGATMNPILAYDIQYFFMGIWLPLGIALFHAANLRFLHVAKRQRMFTNYQTLQRGCNRARTSWLRRLRNADYSTRVLTFISIGMILQIFLTVAMWIACRKYHPTFGIPGTELPSGTPQEQLVVLGQGWEWWPTLLWQFLWSWIVAPYLIIKSWNVHDTLGWRVQTIGCCIANLHATPMFLIASYVPEFSVINEYFTPSNWIHLSIMFFVIFTVFVPCIQVVRHVRLQRQALAFNDARESESRSTSVIFSVGTFKATDSKSSGYAGESGTQIDVLGIEDDRLLTKSALDYVLRTNPSSLQNFSALRDFSGENIAFIVRVSEWKATWFQSLEVDPNETRKMYNRALEIYTSFVSPHDAEFPVNLSWRQLNKLKDMFENAARVMCGEARKVSGASMFDFNEAPDSKDVTRIEFSELAKRAQYTGEIPDTFNAGVFNEAQAHVKQLVFLNTWPKFVKELRENRPKSSETGRSDGTWSSQRTLLERTQKYFKSMF